MLTILTHTHSHSYILLFHHQNFLQIYIYIYIYCCCCCCNILITSMPTGFFIWGYIQIFGDAMYPLTLHLGVQRKLTAFFPRKVVHHAVFCKYYAELAKTFFFCLTLGQTGSGVLSDPWPLCLSHHFFVILYITCQVLFFIQN